MENGTTQVGVSTISLACCPWCFPKAAAEPVPGARRSVSFPLLPGVRTELAARDRMRRAPPGSRSRSARAASIHSQSGRSREPAVALSANCSYALARASAIAPGCSRCRSGIAAMAVLWRYRSRSRAIPTLGVGGRPQPSDGRAARRDLGACSRAACITADGADARPREACGGLRALRGSSSPRGKRQFRQRRR